jgi:hypothetical protein
MNTDPERAAKLLDLCARHLRTVSTAISQLDALGAEKELRLVHRRLEQLAASAGATRLRSNKINSASKEEGVT